MIECAGCEARFVPARPRTLPANSEEPHHEDDAALLGLRTDAELEGRDRLQYRPRRSLVGMAAASVALVLGIVAMPIAVAYNHLTGTGLASLGVLLGAYSVFAAIKRRWAGFGISLLSTAVCGSVLFAAAVLLGKDGGQDDQRTEADAMSRPRNEPGQKGQGGDKGEEVEHDAEEGVGSKKNATEKKHDTPEEKHDAGKEVAGLSPGQVIDESKIKVPTESRFNPKNVNETAEWVIARTLETRQHSGNDFMVSTELKKLSKQMQEYVGQQVEWRFTVERILKEGIRFHQAWSTSDGSRYPIEGIYPRGALMVVQRFRVEFYHEGRELFDPLHPPGGWGMMGMKNEANRFSALCVGRSGSDYRR